MTSNDPPETVHRMFSAFQAGDLDGILDTVHPDSRWTYIGANPKPAKASFVGHAKVRRFFDGIIKRLEITAFDTTQFVVQGETVVVFGGGGGNCPQHGRSVSQRVGTEVCRARQPYS